MEQSYQQVKQELGWADFMVRGDQAIRRQRQLVCCAFSFCWHNWFGSQETAPLAVLETELAPPVTVEIAENETDAVAPTAEAAVGRGKMEAGMGEQALVFPVVPCWPVALRLVRGWLAPWSLLWRCWRAWSNSPPPPRLQALLDWVGNGRPLNLYLRV